MAVCAELGRTRRGGLALENKSAGTGGRAALDPFNIVVFDDLCSAMAISADSSPLVSVVMPAHNAERYLCEALDSVLVQTYARLEIIVVDDGSSDSTWQILERYAAADPRVRPFSNEVNRGIVASRNRAFAEASAEARYFAVLDSDDVCMPDRIAQQVEFLENHPGHALVGGNTLIIDESSAVIGERRYPSADADLRRVITRYNPIAQPTVMIRKAALEEVGVYDERFPRCQDYDLWLRMCARYSIANLPEITLKYRISSTQGKSTHLKASLRYTIQIQRRWLFRSDFFRPFNVCYWVAEHALLLLPEAFTLALFKWMTYRSSKPSASGS
ncbi:MAG: glycosyltransferase family 2 protein [Myxococcales bacterium]|nr:glycosyltransferase family 2 protein [Myxococcales bacterium]